MMPAGLEGPRVRRCFWFGACSGMMAAVTLAVVRKSAIGGQEAVCHPNLSHLCDSNNHEILLVGVQHLDPDEVSKGLVRKAMKAMHPDVVMVEGTWVSGVTAMMVSGSWELHGAPPRPGLGDWTDIGDAAPVALPQPPRRKGWFGRQGPVESVPWPSRSLVPLKVGSWANHLRGSVGGAVAAAVEGAANQGVPLRFMGPQDGGIQGHIQVNAVAEQAARELLEEEVVKGIPMAQADMDTALRRAEAQVRKDISLWLADARNETARVQELLRGDKIPKKISDSVQSHMQELTSRMGTRIAEAMQGYRRGIVVLSADQLVLVERRLQQAGYNVVSQCV